MAEDKNAEQEAMEDRRKRLAQAEAEGDADEAIRIAQENIGRPPAHEVSLEHAERVYGRDPVNADPAMLAEGGEEMARSMPGAEVGANVEVGTAAEEEEAPAQEPEAKQQARRRGAPQEPVESQGEPDDQEEGS